MLAPKGMLGGEGKTPAFGEGSQAPHRRHHRISQNLSHFSFDTKKNDNQPHKNNHHLPGTLVKNTAIKIL